MSEKSLANTNPWIASDARKDPFLVRNIASSTAVETQGNIDDISSRILMLRAREEPGFSCESLEA